MTAKGIVFDIQRGALHDGPGIRSVVFLKGCPMKCSWCCNPESQSPNIQLRYRSALCRHCGECARVCPQHCINAGSGDLKIDFEKCEACGRCVKKCFTHALSLAGMEMTVDDVMEQVYADKRYYDVSGGGLTLSGGDALMQYDFALALLMAAREAGINTCLENEGCTGGERLSRILKWVDHLYWDYKLTDPESHILHTGISNEVVLDSLHTASSANVPVTLRCPVIPSLNDNEEHLHAIVTLQKRYRNIKAVHLLPYHAYGNIKYSEIGLACRCEHMPSMRKEDLIPLAIRLNALGATGVSIP